MLRKPNEYTLLSLMLLALLTLIGSQSIPLVDASPSVLSEALVAYRSNTGTNLLNSPKYGLWVGTAWTLREMTSAGSPVRYARVAYNPNDTRYYEAVVVTLSDDGYLDAYVQTKTGWSVTNNIGYVGTTANAYKAFDVAYEQTTSRALLVYTQTGAPVTTTLRPNAAGDLTEYDTLVGAATHWEAVDEAVSDDDTSYIATTTAGDRDLFSLPDPGLPSTASITSVKVYANARKLAGGDKPRLQLMIRTYGTDYSGAVESLGTSYALKSAEWTTNPNTASAWTSAEIDALQAGVTLPQAYEHRVTQVYVEVTYTPPDIAYKIWDGATWSAEAYLDDPGHTTAVLYNWIALASKPTSGANEIAMIALDDTNSDINGWIWSGTAWGNYQELTGTASINTKECLAVSYEMQSGKAWFAYGDSTTGIGFRRWTGTAWESAISPVSLGETPNWISMKSDPASDEIMLVSVDDGVDLNIIHWDGTGPWTLNAGGWSEDAAVDTDTARCADFDWEPTGSGGILVWGTDTGSLSFKVYSAGVFDVSASTITMAGTHPWVQLRRNPRAVLGDVMVLGATLDSNFDLGSLRWDGTTLTGVAGAFTTDTTVTTYECFELEFQIHIHEAPTVFVDPATQTVGASFSIDINITFGYDIYSWEFNVTYDTTKLTPTNVIEGPFLSAGGTTVFNKWINDTQGWVYAYASLQGDVPGVTGNGALATVNFNIDATGTNILLDLHNTKLAEYDFLRKIKLYYPPNLLKEVDGYVTITVVPEFPFGAIMEIALMAVVVYLWWRNKRAPKLPTHTSKPI